MKEICMRLLHTRMKESTEHVNVTLTTKEFTFREGNAWQTYAVLHPVNFSLLVLLWNPGQLTICAV